MANLKEECGVFGFYDNDGYNVAKMIYYGLYAIQHRGQDSCGISVTNDDTTVTIKDAGLVNEVFNNENLSRLTGKIGVGHVRASAHGMTDNVNAQPLVSHYRKGTLALALNGNIVNAAQLRHDLEEQGSIFQSNNDAEVVMHLLAKARASVRTIEEAMRAVMDDLRGSFSIVVTTPRKLIGVRDPHGIRPLCFGSIGDSYVLSSETAGLDVIGAELIRDIRPGEIIVINQDGVKSLSYENPPKPALCVFEYVYFARPDSVIDGVSVYNARIATGRRLATVAPVEADIVIGVPDSGLSFASGYAIESGIPYSDGFIKNRYTGRTFIKPNQDDRVAAVNIKLNALRANIMGKRIVMVDDSIVRGTTCANIIRMLKENGAKEVHLRIASPKFLWPCFFGTDIPTRKDLIAVHLTTEEICKKVGADTLAFLPVDELQNIGLRTDFGYCDACFTGDYPVEVGEID